MPRKKKITEKKAMVDQEDICTVDENVVQSVCNDSNNQSLFIETQLQEALDKIKDMKEPEKSSMENNLNRYYNAQKGKNNGQN